MSPQPDQLDLFAAPKVASVRRSDPRPARVAAAQDPEGRASQADRLLLHCYRTGGRVTADYAWRNLMLDGEQITRGEWSTRLGVLVHRGHMEHAGEKPEPDRRGRVRNVLAYRLTEAGVREAQRLTGRAVA